VSSARPSRPVADASLRRLLGRWDLTAIGINQVIGAAVFLVPAQIAFHLGPWSPLAVLLVGLSTILVGLCFAEVGSRFETTGGAYLYSKAAFGRFVGFEVAWLQWFTRVAGLASVSNGIAITLSPFWPSVASGLGRMLLIGGITLTLMFVNLIGIRQSSNLVNALTLAKLAPLVGFLLLGVWFIHPRYYPPIASVGRENLVAATLLLVFTFGGFDVVGVPAGEAKAPRRDVPIALITTIGGVTLILISIQVLLMFTLPDLAHSKTPIADAMQSITGPAGAYVVATGAVFSMVGNNAGQILSGSRTLFSLAAADELPAFFGRVHPRFKTPSNAIVITTAAALALALSGTFAKMAAISAVARLAAYVATAAATLALRRRDRTHGAPAALFKIPGGSAVPILALATCVLMLCGATAEQLTVGAIAVIVGAVLFALAPGPVRTSEVVRARIF
jgi:basic amino acid/polyamine antiporter, APA family